MSPYLHLKRTLHFAFFSFLFFSSFSSSVGCTHGTWKFPGQGLNPSNSSDLSYSSDNPRSLTARPLGNSCIVFYSFFFVFLRLHLWHMEVPRVGV